MIKVSVIVPIYRVARYIERCIMSLMAQSMDDIEYIFVDDASDDNSINILNSIINNYCGRQIRILHHETNKGLPAARNTGMEVASGEYVYHCDSDDWLDSCLLEGLYQKANEIDADIVWSDYVEVRHSGSIVKIQPDAQTSEEAVSMMLSSKLKYNVWNKLVKRSLYERSGIRYPSGYSMGEDMTMIMLCSAANRVASIHGPCYYYNMMNSAAMTQTRSEEKLVSLYKNIVRLDEYLIKDIGSRFEKEMDFFKLNAKWPFLIIDCNRKMIRLWADWFPEANKSIWEQPVSFRIKLIDWCASKRMCMLVRLHYILVIKLFYKLFGK